MREKSTTTRVEPEWLAHAVRDKTLRKLRALQQQILKETRSALELLAAEFGYDRMSFKNQVTARRDGVTLRASALPALEHIHQAFKATHPQGLMSVWTAEEGWTNG